MHKFIFEKFEKKHYSEYQSWFSDPDIKNALGYIDDEWLNYILNDQEGIELVAIKDSMILAVIGLHFPSPKDPTYTITNIAVKPQLKNKGFGSQILSALINEYPLKNNEYWVCHVDPQNKNAQRFFEKNAWEKSQEQDMIKYILKNSSS